MSSWLDAPSVETRRRRARAFLYEFNSAVGLRQSASDRRQIVGLLGDAQRELSQLQRQIFAL